MKPEHKQEVKAAERTANVFMIRVAEGVVGWASFAQAANLSAMYSESLTYLPIFEIAKARRSNGLRWRVVPQKKLKRGKSGQGRFPTVDFMFCLEDFSIGIFLEVKYARYNTEHCLQITKDIRKLYSLAQEDVSQKQNVNHVLKYILILGRKQNILTRIHANAKPLAKLDIKKLTYSEDKRLLVQVEEAFEAFDGDKARSSSSKIHAWAFSGVGSPNLKYWAVLLREEDWWKSVGDISTAVAPSDEELNDDEATADDLENVPDTDADE